MEDDVKYLEEMGFTKHHMFYYYNLKGFNVFQSPIDYTGKKITQGWILRKWLVHSSEEVAQFKIGTLRLDFKAKVDEYKLGKLKEAADIIETIKNMPF
jgi:hypothetical protein